MLFLFINFLFSKDHKIIMVTAATGALGQVICSDLAAKGYDLFVTGRSQEKLSILKKELLSKYKKAHISTAIIDFMNPNTIYDARKQFKDKKLNGIVLIGPRPSLSKSGIPEKEAWSTAFSETFIGPLEVIKTFDDLIADQSSIVVIVGVSSKYYLPGYANNNVMRLSWLGEVKNLAWFFGKRKIRVNAISPGVVLTEHHQERIKKFALEKGRSYEEQIAEEVSTTPLEKFADPKDVAHLTSFLLSDQAKHINGDNIALDGGQSTTY